MGSAGVVAAREAQAWEIAEAAGVIRWGDWEGGILITVKRYSMKRDATRRVARNFLAGEFACHDGADGFLIAGDLLDALQSVRDYFDAPVAVMSGFRTPSHNKKVGGKPNSQHLLGTAADITVDGKKPLEVYRAIDNGWVPGVDPDRIGLGLYGTFVHVDVRGRKARWQG